MIVIVTESDFLCDDNFDSDELWLCLSIKVIAIVMVIQTMTDSKCVCHLVWLPFNSDSGSDRQGFWLSLGVISFVMVILTVTDSDMV